MWTPGFGLNSLLVWLKEPDSTNALMPKSACVFLPVEIEVAWRNPIWTVYHGATIFCCEPSEKNLHHCAWKRCQRPMELEQLQWETLSNRILCEAFHSSRCLGLCIYFLFLKLHVAPSSSYCLCINFLFLNLNAALHSFCCLCICLCIILLLFFFS